MPRPKTIQNRGFISLIIENKYAELLEHIARKEGITKSELVRRIIIEWLENEAKVKYGLEEVFAVAQASDTPHLLPLTAKRVSEIEATQKEIAKQLVELKRYFESIKPEDLKTMRSIVELWRKANEQYDYTARRTTVDINISVFRFKGYVKDIPREQYTIFANKLAEFEEKVKQFRLLRGRFFKEVYYKYKYEVKEDVPYEKRQMLESLIARQLELIDMTERKLKELGIEVKTKNKKQRF
ncbi:MAG: ribbon-helix-helix domain-containing protein [Fervidicoccaceae archaeon]|uniref:ribbon-helix-helix domain-containing protein n=1 Tax=Thermofilum sp. TaxID=1961369 RepID=UPI003167F62A